ncbi:site-specific integrase [Pseudomonas sp. SA3-5]|uniref:Site-specific integrase n=1 Tax=Pseudomonas aestuarii TaxID=3018340 RepID=A0ABT4XM84_9PSED|nr:site-specific integrase [Pseudomonas aestuarii]MDA7089280.1 site-specific integrase [Pseudomonas aestuarii]
MQCTNTLTLTVPQHLGFNYSEIVSHLQSLLNDPAQLSTILERVPAPSFAQPNLSMSIQTAADKMIWDYTVKGTWKHGTAYKYRSQLKQIVEFLGKDRPVLSLSLADLTNLQETLSKKKKNTQALVPLDELDMISTGVEEIVRGETAHRYFNLLKQFMTYCEHKKWLIKLPLNEVMLPPLSKQQRHYKTFTPLELEGVFHSRIYTTQAAENFRWIPFSYCFWLPLLGAFTGARPGELCQLYAGDIFKSAGIWVIRITDEGPEQRLKTAFSAREIPIHPTLVDIGFLDFVAMRQKEGGRYRPLFPELPYDKKHGFARTASRWFSGQGANDHGYLPECGFYKGMGACLYSFRHTFVNSLRNGVGAQELMIKMLIGHGTNDDTTTNYGEELSLSRRQTTIAKVNFDVDLSHISWENYQKLQQRKPHCLKEKRKAPDLRRR